ncbi:MAG: hypothetical protein SGILL_000835 [Bacillariaceae sp.]
MAVAAQGSSANEVFLKTRGFFHFFNNHVLEHDNLEDNPGGRGAWKQFVALANIDGLDIPAGSRPEDVPIRTKIVEKQFIARFNIKMAVFNSLTLGVPVLDNFFFQWLKYVRAMATKSSGTNEGQLVFECGSAPRYIHGLVRHRWNFDDNDRGFIDAYGKFIEYGADEPNRIVPALQAAASERAFANTFPEEDVLQTTMPRQGQVGAHGSTPTVAAEPDYSPRPGRRSNQDLHPLSRRTMGSSPLVDLVNECNNDSSKTDLQKMTFALQTLVEMFAASLSPAQDMRQLVPLAGETTNSAIGDLLAVMQHKGHLTQRDVEVVGTQTTQWATSVDAQIYAAHKLPSPEAKEARNCASGAAQTARMEQSYRRVRAITRGSHTMKTTGRIMQELDQTLTNTRPRSQSQEPDQFPTSPRVATVPWLPNNGFGDLGKGEAAYITLRGMYSLMRSYTYCDEEDVAGYFQYLLRFIREREPGVYAEIMRTPLPQTLNEKYLTGVLDMLDHIEWVSLLGAGTFGNAFSGNVRGYPGLKVCSKVEPVPVERFLKFARSIEQQCKVRHDGVAKIYGVFPVGIVQDEEGEGCVLMETLQECGNGTLFDLIQDSLKRLTEHFGDYVIGELTREQLKALLMRAAEQQLSCLLEILDIVVAVVDVGVMHRDIKSINLVMVMGQELKIILIDFGEARPKFAQGHTNAGTGWVGTEPNWPPLPGTAFQSPNHDVYSAGTVGIELFAGYLLNPNRHNTQRGPIYTAERLRQMILPLWMGSQVLDGSGLMDWNRDSFWDDYFEMIDDVAVSLAKLVLVNDEKTKCPTDAASAVAIIECMFTRHFVQGA